MFSIGNAMMWQVEVVQEDHWEYGPLQLVFIPERKKGLEQTALVWDWNRSLSGGFSRPSDALDFLRDELRITNLENPNLIAVPRQRNGYSELHAMLASLVPQPLLDEFGIKRLKANLALFLRGGYPDYDMPNDYAIRACAAFERYIWTKLAPKARMRADFFSSSSPLRLLAGDALFWMHRMYRIALDRAEDAPEAKEMKEDRWQPLDVLEAKLKDGMEPEHRDKFRVRRPLVGGTLCDIEDPEERDFFVDEMIDGAGVMESLDPVIEALHSHRVHEDFSDQYSWIKEDFERSFYSKRAKLKVTLVETVDEMPVWSSDEQDGYERVLFRDVLAFLNPAERHLVIALRSGKTTTEISRELGHKGHAAVSRRVKKLQAKVKALFR